MAKRTQGNVPINKVRAGGLAGAFATILVFVLNSYVLKGKQTITPEITGGIATVFSFAVAWMTPPGQNEKVIDTDEKIIDT